MNNANTSSTLAEELEPWRLRPLPVSVVKVLMSLRYNLYSEVLRNSTT